MSNDLAIIEKLEKRLGRKFKKKFIGFHIFLFNKPTAQYELNDKGQVIQLYLCRLDSQEILLEVAQLQSLQQLYLHYNQLSIWPKEMALLQNLQDLDLRFNQLSVWPKQA